VRRQSQRIDAQRPKIDGDFAKPLHRVAMQPHAGRTRQPRDLLDRLQGAGLVVGQHDRHQPRPPLGDQIFERAKIDRAVSGYRNFAGPRQRLEHAIMFDCRHQTRLGRKPVQGRSVGFGAAAGENDARSAAMRHAQIERQRQLCARGLDDLARRPPGAMHRRGIADHIERRQHGIARAHRQRRRRVPIEIDLGCRRWGHCAAAIALASAITPDVPSTRRWHTSASVTLDR
jgi:hypothetical protein